MTPGLAETVERAAAKLGWRALVMRDGRVRLDGPGEPVIAEDLVDAVRQLVREGARRGY